MKSINLIQYNKIDSTQNEIWRLVENNQIKDNTIVIANIQTEGRGTHGRIWHTDEPNNIAFSFYIETNCNIKKLEGITIDIAKIIVEIFKEDYDINLDIKQPNDLIINGKKVGGILTESKIQKENVKFLVVGIGINTSKTVFTEDIKDIATSINIEFNKKIDTVKFIEKFYSKFKETLKGRIK